MNENTLTLLWLLVPIAIYIIVRLASTAYFRSKREYMRRLTDDDTPNR